MNSWIDNYDISKWRSDNNVVQGYFSNPTRVRIYPITNSTVDTRSIHNNCILPIPPNSTFI